MHVMAGEERNKEAVLSGCLVERVYVTRAPYHADLKRNRKELQHRKSQPAIRRRNAVSRRNAKRRNVYCDPCILVIYVTVRYAPMIYENRFGTFVPVHIRNADVAKSRDTEFTRQRCHISREKKKKKKLYHCTNLVY